MDRVVRCRARWAVSLLTVVLVVLVGYGEAGAHGGQGSERPPASNYRSEIVEISPTVDGVSVSVVDAGSRLELSNTSDVDVVVLGYDGDPYLRIGPDGVFENSHSAAVSLNADRFGRMSIPISANSDADPVWRRVSSDRSVRWHDHRAHWMNETPPAAVLADPDRSTQLVSEWMVPLEVDGTEVIVSGTLGWVEPPSPVWWWLLALVAAGVVVLAGRRWRSWTPIVASVVLLVATVLNAAGAWVATPGGIVPRVGTLTLPVMLWLLLGAGIVLFRRSRIDALLLIGLASAGLVGVFGLVDLGWLSSAVLPSALPVSVARGTVALAIGVGSGLAVYAAGEVGPALVRRAAVRRAAAEQVNAEIGSSAAPVTLGRRSRWVLLVLAAAIVVGIGVISSPDESSAMIDPTLPGDVCAATSGSTARVDDEMHVRLHQLVATTAEGDPEVAQRLSDSLDSVDPDVSNATDPVALRSGVDAALAATGQDRLDCAKS